MAERDPIELHDGGMHQPVVFEDAKPIVDDAARKKRRKAVLAADAAGVPRLRISKEVGMQRSNVYKLLEGDDGDES